MPICIPLAVVIMNMKSYNELPPNLQKILSDSFRETEEELIKAVQADDTKGRATMREKGMTVTEFTPAELAPFKEIGMKTWDELVTKNPGTSAPEMLNIVKQFSK
jgi:TRAP-type C4-dicarboxylate transport system substrate-binding protein